MLVASGVSAGSYGSASGVATVTFDAKGRATAAGTVAITPAAIGAANASHTHSAADITSGTLDETRGGTGHSTFTTGDLLYASDSVTLSRVGTQRGLLQASSLGGVPFFNSFIDIDRIQYKGLVSPSSIGSSQNNYAPLDLLGCNVLRLTSSAAVDITGIGTGNAAQMDGSLLTIHNIGSHPITLKSQSASSTAANRFAILADVVLSPGELVTLWYDRIAERWQLYASGYARTLNGSATLGATYSITASAGTYADTGLSVTLPQAGTYLVTANVRGALQATGTNPSLSAKLYNATDASDITNSERLVVRTGATTLIEATAVITAIVTVTASKTIALYALRNAGGSPTWTTSDIASGAAGRTTLSYIKIG
jgi:hypothetical protein